jgi:hypothetical protein
MRMHGWCLKCHKFKTVNVKYPGVSKIPYGICATCEEPEREPDRVR